MKFFNTIPNWVKSFPYELDRQALTQLAKSSSGAFDKPREMNFEIAGVKPGKDADALCDHISKAGWKCATDPQQDNPGKLNLTATKSNYSITHESYMSDSVFFQRAARQYNCEYAGWFASN